MVSDHLCPRRQSLSELAGDFLYYPGEKFLFAPVFLIVSDMDFDRYFCFCVFCLQADV